MSASTPTWRLDRQITLAMAFAIIVETAGALIWAGAAAERIAQVEVDARRMGDAAERLARIEEQVSSIRAQLDRVEARMFADN